MKCIILAGGFGTRLGNLAAGKAKGLIEYKSKPLVTHIINKVPEDVNILLSTNRKFEVDFRKWQETINRDVEICVEPAVSNEQRLGATGSLNFWIENKAITEDLLVIASDNYFEFDLAQFIAVYDGKNTLVAVYDIGDKSKASQFGVVELNGHRIVAFEEKPAEPRSSIITTAIYILPPRIFPLLSQYCSQGRRDNLGDFIAYIMDRDEVRAYVFSEFWIDIGSGGNKGLFAAK